MHTHPCACTYPEKLRTDKEKRKGKREEESKREGGRKERKKEGRKGICLFFPPVFSLLCALQQPFSFSGPSVFPSEKWEVWTRRLELEAGHPFRRSRAVRPWTGVNISEPVPLSSKWGKIRG